jgi:hypothetical protein
MRTIRKVLAAIPLVLLAPQVFGTTVKIDFNGIFTSTYDQTSTIFRNGTAANSGAGLPISGSILWTFPQSFCSTTFCLSDLDIALHPTPVDVHPFHWSVNIGGVEYNSDLNYGARDTVFLYDEQAGAAQDNWNASLHAYGLYQLEPEVNGLFDSLRVERALGLNLTDPSGEMIQLLDFSQPIDWTSGINGYGTGSIGLWSRICEDDNGGVFCGPPGTGTPGTILQSGGGGFVLTSFRSAQVPEPESFALLIAGLAAMFAGRRNWRTSRR